MKKEYWRFADLTIPAGVPLYRPNLEKVNFGYEIKVKAKIPSYKDGRHRGSKPVWRVTYNYNVYLLPTGNLNEYGVTLDSDYIRAVMQK